MYVGVKSIFGTFGSDARQGAWLTLLLFGSLFHFLAIRFLVKVTICPPGLIRRGLHGHALNYLPSDDLKSDAECNSCECFLEYKTHLYRCPDCAVYFCSDCFNKTETDAKRQRRSIATSFRMLSHSFRLFFPEKRTIFGAFLASLVSSLLGFYASVLHGDGVKALLGDDNSKRENLFGILSWMALIELCVILSSGLQSSLISIAQAETVKRVRERLFYLIVFQSLHFWDSRRTSDLTQTINSRADTIVQLCRIVYTIIVHQILPLSIGLAACWTTSWRLTILAGAFYAPLLYSQSFIGQYILRASNGVEASSFKAYTCAVQTFEHMRLVRAFSTEDFHRKQHERRTKMDAAQTSKHAFLVCLQGLAWVCTWFAARVFVFAAGAYLTHLPETDPNRLTTGDLVAFQLYLQKLATSVEGISQRLLRLSNCLSSTEKLVPLLQLLPAIDHSSGYVVSKEKHNFCVEFQNVTFAYLTSPDVQVLQNIDLSIPANTVCALVGKSGSGKTTLVSLLLRLYNLKPVEATDVRSIHTNNDSKIAVGHMNVAEMNLRSFHDCVGYVSQETSLFRGTVLANISYGLDPKLVTPEALEVACKMANAFEFIQKLEKGYETRVGTGGSSLSGGQKQRIALARVFLRKPKLVVLDEATSALDAISEEKVQDSIDKLLAEEGCTVILIAHRLSTVVKADHIAVMDEGKLVEQGTHEELLQLNGLYAALTMRQRQETERRRTN